MYLYGVVVARGNLADIDGCGIGGLKLIGDARLYLRGVAVPLFLVVERGDYAVCPRLISHVLHDIRRVVRTVADKIGDVSAAGNVKVIV